MVICCFIFVPWVLLIPSLFFLHFLVCINIPALLFSLEVGLPLLPQGSVNFVVGLVVGLLILRSPARGQDILSSSTYSPDQAFYTLVPLTSLLLDAVFGPLVFVSLWDFLLV